MKTTIGNYMKQVEQHFPCDCELFDSIQQNRFLMNVSGNIGGDKIILAGCGLAQNNSWREEGYVFVRTKDFPDGEVLYWEGGAVTSGIYLKKQTVAVETLGKEYDEAYTIRTLAPGLGNERFTWNEFVTASTHPELAKEIFRQEEILNEAPLSPVGTIELWAGNINSVPDKYMLCDGTSLPITDYPELYRVVGNLHATSTATTFRIPDLRALFIGGYSNKGDTDFNAIAKKGGAKSVSLKTTEIPSHVHSFKDYYFLECYANGGYEGYDNIGRGIHGTNANDNDNNYMYYRIHDTYSTGTNSAHENRPPYYTLSYIIKIKS